MENIKIQIKDIDTKIKDLQNTISYLSLAKRVLIKLLSKEEDIILSDFADYKVGYCEIFENLVILGLFEKLYFRGENQFTEDEMNEFRKNNAFVDNYGTEHYFNENDFSVDYKRI